MEMKTIEMTDGIRNEFSPNCRNAAWAVTRRRATGYSIPFTVRKARVLRAGTCRTSARFAVLFPRDSRIRLKSTQSMNPIETLARIKRICIAMIQSANRNSICSSSTKGTPLSINET